MGDKESPPGPKEPPPGPNEPGYVDFIYGGPWIPNPTEAPLFNSATPRNVPLRGIYKRSFAYKTLKDRVPIILTKVIDTLSRTGGDTSAIQDVSQLKSELVTNKKMTQFKETSDEAKYWNKCLQGMDDPYYFTTVWVYAECYVYRRIREVVGTKDPFEQQKRDAFNDNLEASCLAAQKLNEFVNSDRNKESIVTLLKLCLWANKCDLSLSANPEQIVDPVKMIADLKPNLLADDTNRIANYILNKRAVLQRKIDKVNFEKIECNCNKLAAAKGLPTHVDEEDEDEEEPEVDPDNINPCPSKLKQPTKVMFDIVCDNSAYELVTDLCLGYFLLKKGLVKKVRYHVKSMPWFVSDVTPDDFDWVVSQCANADYSREISGEDGNDAVSVTSEHLQTLGEGIQEYIEAGAISVESDQFWTTPTLYKDMKRLDPAMYRKLQFSFMVVFKGDLNYRKLIGETNWAPTTKFLAALQGFTPAPVVAIRTVKADLIAGLPKGKYETCTKKDPEWMEKGDYGVIQFSQKKEALKVSDSPCPEFGETCKGKCK